MGALRNRIDALLSDYTEAEILLASNEILTKYARERLVELMTTHRKSSGKVYQLGRVRASNGQEQDASAGKASEDK